MTSIKKTSALERSVLLTLVFTVLVVTPYSVMDPMNLPKMTVLGVSGFLTLGLIARNRNGLLVNYLRPVLLLTLSFQALLILNTIFSGRNLAENFYGTSGRNTGVLTYLALSILMFASTLVSNAHFIKTFRNVFFAIALTLFLYGVVQFTGFEPFPYVNAYENNVFGTFGNPNFQSAFMGIVGTMAIVSVFDRELSTRVRILICGIATTSVFGIYSTNSWQGYFNLFAGVATGFILLLFKWKRQKSGFFLLIASIVTGIIVALGIFSIGPLTGIIGKASLEARRLYWEAAIQIIKSNPSFGVGFDGFGDWYRRGRSADAATNSGGLLSTSAHNVPLDIGVGGGLPALTIYTTLILLALWRIIQNIKSSSDINVVYFSICAAWVSYQVQTLISINQIGLAIIGWILLGLVIGYRPVPETKSFQKSSVQINQPDNSFVSFITPIVGLIVGLVIALPPFVAAGDFYSSLKSSDIKAVQATALQSPLDSQRMLYAAQVLENNKFYNQSIEMVREINTQFPDSYEAWSYLRTLVNSTIFDKQKALQQIRRLDPNFVEEI